MACSPLLNKKGTEKVDTRHVSSSFSFSLKNIFSFSSESKRLQDASSHFSLSFLLPFLVNWINIPHCFLTSSVSRRFPFAEIHTPYQLHCCGCKNINFTPFKKKEERISSFFVPSYCLSMTQSELLTSNGIFYFYFVLLRWKKNFHIAMIEANELVALQTVEWLNLKCE